MATNPIGILGLDEGEFTAKFCRSGVDINTARPLDLVWSANSRSMYLVEEAAFEVPYGNVSWNEFMFTRTYPGVPFVLHTMYTAEGGSWSHLTGWHVGPSNTTFLTLGYAAIVEPHRILTQQMVVNPVAYMGISIYWFEPLE